MNITRINIQPEFRGNISVYADGPKRTYGEVIDAKNIKKIYWKKSDRFTYLGFKFSDLENKEDYRTIIIGDYDDKCEDIRNRYMRFLQTYSIALQAPDNVTVTYFG